MLSRFRKWVFSVILLHPAEVATASTGGGWGGGRRRGEEEGGGGGGRRRGGWTTEKTPENFSWIYVFKNFPAQIFFAVILVRCSGLTQNLRKCWVSVHCFATFVEASFYYTLFFLSNNIGSFLLTPPPPTHPHIHTHTHWWICEIINLKFSLLQVYVCVCVGGEGSVVNRTENIQQIPNSYLS